MHVVSSRPGSWRARAPVQSATRLRFSFKIGMFRGYHFLWGGKGWCLVHFAGGALARVRSSVLIVLV